MLEEPVRPGSADERRTRPGRGRGLQADGARPRPPLRARWADRSARYSGTSRRCATSSTGRRAHKGAKAAALDELSPPRSTSAAGIAGKRRTAWPCWMISRKGATPTGFAIGIGAALLAPVLVPAVSSVLRPAAKAVMRTGIMLYRSAAEPVSAAVGDLVAEAQLELAAASRRVCRSLPRAARSRRHPKRRGRTSAAAPITMATRAGSRAQSRASGDDGNGTSKTCSRAATSSPAWRSASARRCSRRWWCRPWAAVLRPAAKAVIKGGIVAYDWGRQADGGGQRGSERHGGRSPRRDAHASRRPTAAGAGRRPKRIPPETAATALPHAAGEHAGHPRPRQPEAAVSSSRRPDPALRATRRDARPRASAVRPPRHSRPRLRAGPGALARPRACAAIPP